MLYFISLVQITLNKLTFVDLWRFQVLAVFLSHAILFKCQK